MFVFIDILRVSTNWEKKMKITTFLLNIVYYFKKITIDRKFYFSLVSKAMSYLWNGLSICKMSYLLNVLSMKCPIYEMSYL